MADESNPKSETSTPPEQQAFSREYVDDLRQESARYRTRAKELEAAARKALCLEPDADCGDLEALLAARVEASAAVATEKALDKANARLITAEIRALSGYDTTLLERLIDRSGIAVGDDGTVTGVKEAAEAAEKQFPVVLKAKSVEQWAPSNPPAGGPPKKKPSEMTYLCRNPRPQRRRRGNGFVPKSKLAIDNFAWMMYNRNRQSLPDRGKILSLVCRLIFQNVACRGKCLKRFKRQNPCLSMLVGGLNDKYSLGTYRLDMDVISS